MKRLTPQYPKGLSVQEFNHFRESFQHQLATLHKELHEAPQTGETIRKLDERFREITIAARNLRLAFGGEATNGRADPMTFLIMEADDLQNLINRYHAGFCNLYNVYNELEGLAKKIVDIRVAIHAYGLQYHAEDFKPR